MDVKLLKQSIDEYTLQAQQYPQSSASEVESDKPDRMQPARLGKVPAWKRSMDSRTIALEAAQLRLSEMQKAYDQLARENQVEVRPPVTRALRAKRPP